MPRKASFTPDSRLKWRKRKRGSNASPSPSAAADHSDDSYSADDDDTAVPSAAAAVADDADDGVLAGASPEDPALDLREAEVLSAAEAISAFPAAARRTVNRPHRSVLAVIAAERSAYAGDVSAVAAPALENISHGQLQVLSGALPDHPSLSTDPDRPSSYVCTPPPLMEGHGVPKQFQGRLHVVPKHSDWFYPGTVHRLEMQIVPHFFTGKSLEHTPEKYILLRNKVIAKYLENPGKRLAFGECQGLVANTGELYDLSRIVRFLDTWGIINYLAVGLVHRGLRMAASLLREEPAGELQLLTAPLKSIDGLILFDRPKCSLQAEDVSSSSSNAEVVDFDAGSGFADLEGKIRERLSESSCSYCLQSLCSLHYQSQKEVDISLCSDCFHDARYITGHSSLDFRRVDVDKDGSENDGNNWTDQETLLLLEGIEKHNDNWNDIAEHVGTKSKAQCIYHFLRLPVEDSLLENIEVPDASMPFRVQSNGYTHSDTNDSTSVNLPQSTQDGNQLPFINSSNPVMSLVAFLASAIGPRVAASCASAALSVLTRDDDPRGSSEGMHADGRGHGAHPNFRDHNGASSSISPENVKHAAMCGLSAAAMKSKLFADQEEREIQRLAATVINHQLKRLELKLKQFAEVETLLLKECEQVERARQRISADRIRVISARLNSTGSSLPGGSSSMASNSMNISPRPMALSGSMAQSTMPATYADNMQGHGHPQMPFLQRQPQMLSFGPRLPLSAIQTQPSAQASNIMFNSAMPNSVTPNHHHQLLRSSSGNNSS